MSRINKSVLLEKREEAISFCDELYGKGSSEANSCRIGIVNYYSELIVVL